MSNLFLTPGPTQIHEIVQEAFRFALDSDICSISHRSKEYDDLSIHTESNLRMCLQIPKDHRVFFLPSGTESWERIIQNGAEKTTFHLVNGAFSKRFYETSIELGKQAGIFEKPLGQGFEIGEIPQNIHAEIICVTQNETSTGCSLPEGFVEEIGKIYPDSLIAVDAVSCAPYSKIDLSWVDYYLFSVQKFFCMPAGLGVLIVSPRAIEKAKFLQNKGASIGAHHSLLSLDQFAQKHQTPCTPNVIGIYALGQIANHLHTKGMKKVREETDQKAKLLYDCLDQHDRHKAAIKNPRWRSNTVITVDAGKDLQRVTDLLAQNHLIVGQGYGSLKDAQFRVANFSAHRLEDFQKLCKLLTL